MCYSSHPQFLGLILVTMLDDLLRMFLHCTMHGLDISICDRGPGVHPKYSAIYMYILIDVQMEN